MGLGSKHLTPKALPQMLGRYHQNLPVLEGPVTLQIIALPRLPLHTEVKRTLNSNSTNERVKITLSDGEAFMQGIVATQAAEQGQGLVNFSVINVLSYIITPLNTTVQRVEDRLVAVLTNFEIVAIASGLIGTPVHVKALGLLSPQAPLSAQGTVPDSGYGAPPAQQASYGQRVKGESMQFANGSYGQPVQANSSFGQPQQDVGLQKASGCGNPPEHASAYGALQTPYGASVTVSAGLTGQPYNALPPRYDNRGPVARNENAPHVIPIKGLSSYIGRWTIKGRCTMKGELKKFTNKQGRPGCVFNFDLMDSSGEIRVVAFSEVAEKFFDHVEQGRMYQLSKATLKPIEPGKRKWNNTGHSSEIYLENNSILEEDQDGKDVSIPKIHVNLIKIADIGSVEPGNMVDIMGVVESCNDVSSITRRDGTEAKKRDMTLRDDSNASIDVTLWGDKADIAGTEIFNAVRGGCHPVVVLKSALPIRASGKVGDFNGRSLSSLGSSVILVDPSPSDVPGVAELRSWYDQGGAAQQAQALTQAGKGGGRADRRATLGMIKDELLGSHGQPAWIKVPAVIFTMRFERMTYPACTGERAGKMCQKKMISQDNGSYYCETCQREGQPTWRYLLNMSIIDFDSQLQNVSVFGETGETVMNGMSADRVHEIESDDAALNRAMLHVMYQAKMFKIKCAEDNYNNEWRIKYTVQSCEPIDYASESSVLISMMEDLKMGRPVAALQAPEPRSSNTGMREATSPGYAVGGYKAGAVASPGTALAPQLQGSGVPSFGPPCFGGVSQPGYGSVVMPMHGGVYQHGHVGNSGPADGMAMPGGVYQQQSMPQQMGGQYGMPPANAGYTVGGAAFL